MVQNATPVPTKDNTKRGRARNQAAATESRNRDNPRTKEATPDNLFETRRSVN